MARKKDRSPEEQVRREKIRELLRLANVGSMDDIHELFKETIGEFMENGLEAELDEELGYSKYDYRNKATDNSRNPCTNMLAAAGEERYDPEHATDCVYSYFEHEWTGNEGMYYMTRKKYRSRTFTDYTHPMSEIISGMCRNGIVVTGLQEYDHDISGGFAALDHRGFPLSMIIQGQKTAGQEPFADISF